MEPRLMLTDEFWSKLKPIMLENGIYDKSKLRPIIEGILYRMRVGCPWRDLPPYFGHWNTIYKRFNDWSSKNKIMSIFKAMIEDPDFEWKFIDGSIVKAHQHSTGAAKEEETGIGKSVGGNTTKIHLVVESHGFPVDFIITGGHVHDVMVVPELILNAPIGGYFVADRGYDSEDVRNFVKELNGVPMIPRKCNSKIGNNDMDWNLYKFRHLVENMFARLKQFRSIATRFDKLKKVFEGTVAMACAYIWLSK